jgi:prepilin-type processing-associated H-X9-DG protein
VLESQPRSRWTKWGAVIVVMILAGAWIGLRFALQARELRLRLICASNLEGMTTAARMYANDPVLLRATSLDETVRRLIQLGYLRPEQTICPRSKKPYVFNPAATATVGSDQSAEPDGRRVIAYEPLSYHGGKGANVLYADGHCSFERPAAFEKLVDGGWINTNGCVRAR